MTTRMLNLAAVTALLVATPAYGQDRTGEIDKIFSWVAPDGPGCVAAASQHGKILLNRAYGLADLERNVPLTTDSVFDVGSVRKQFVAAAILLLVDEGRLSLADDVRKHIPELPDYGHVITVDHLLTHTSGIRDWVPLLNFANGDPDAMSMILAQRRLNFPPGEEWSYSNSGYVLLPEIVKRTSGMAFAEFLRTRLFEPLGMKKTTYVDDVRFVIRDRALAYEKVGNRWRMDMLLANDRGGAGALFSTASDLLVWNDALNNARLGRFVSDKIQEPATLNNGRRLNYGRGLMLDTNYAGSLIWHGGSAAAYKSVLGRFPEKGFSIAILCNAGEHADARTRFAGRIFDLFTSPTGTRPDAPAAAPTPSAGVESADVKSKAGLFFNERTGEPLRLAADNGRLSIVGGPTLVTVAQDRFRNPRGSLSFMSQDEFELHFLSDDQFELESMEGQTTRYRRARGYAPAADDLNGFAGRYESAELRAVLEVAAGKDGLLIRLNDSPAPVPFAPVDRDAFQFGRLMLRFLRDERGRVIGIDFSNPVLRNVEFTRVSDGISPPAGR